MQEANRVAKNTAFLYAQMGITVFISLYATRLVLDALGTEDFGIYNLVGGAIAMLTFLNTAMTAASQRFMSFAKGQNNYSNQLKIFNISIALHFLIGLIIVVILEVLGYYLFDGILNVANDRIETAKNVYQFLIISTFFTIYSVPYDAVINAHENMLLISILRVVESILKLAVALFITKSLGDKLYVYGLLMTCLTILLLFVKQIYCHKNYSEVKIRVRKYFDKSLFKEMTSFAGWSFLGSSTSIIANYGQGIVLNVFFGTRVNASQGVANQVAGQLGAFAGVMLKALNPVLAKSEGAGNRSLMLKASAFGSKMSFFLLVLFFIPAMIEMPFILGFWLVNVPEYAIIFCVLLLVRNLIEQLFYTLTSSIGAVGDIKEFRIYTSALNFFPLLISYVLFEFDYPPYFLYIVFIIYALINSIMILFFAKKYCDLSISLFLKNVVFKCFITFFIVLLLSLIPHIFLEEGFVRLFIVGLISFTLLITSIWYIGFTIDEQKLIEKIFKNLRNRFK
ncbi:MATE family efflux transporter [Hyunsoonleella sp. 2307UL5-6]|uniref:MATE family efflux transporter n=1 Tax=Hyunsoonleella sp. 2307UL5-6 TaxID=3384768 RepID=UPI0039BCC55F